ncbi:MAG: methionyl-tRNA formyltransferase [Clostridia bacterium]|nr:methionyl-tRNA formyltransferase [Clostridia bacterium]
MRIAFLGTPEFALPSLDMLRRSGHALTVFTQPDRPVGRHKAPVPPPVKRYAAEHGIPALQFERIKSPEGLAALRAAEPELMITAAFGQLLSAENLSVPKLGCINVHGSLLPKYRGASPIQWAVIQGERETGVTTMFTDAGMDTGDMLLSDRVSIGEDETAGELYARLAELGAGTLSRTLDALLDGSLRRVPQDASRASYCPMLKKEHGRLDFTRPAAELHNLVRGTNPWPGAFGLLEGEPLKIWRTRHARGVAAPSPASPGQCFGDAKSGLYVLCGDDALEILELQAPGGRRLDGRSFLRGRPIGGRILT